MKYPCIQAAVVSVYDQMVCEVECFIVVIYQVSYTDIDLTIDPGTNAQLCINIMRCVCVMHMSVTHLALHYHSMCV